MIIRITVSNDDGSKRKEMDFDNPIDVIAYICRCFQATRRAHGLYAAMESFLCLNEGGAK